MNRPEGVCIIMISSEILEVMGYVQDSCKDGGTLQGNNQKDQFSEESILK
jgi:ABC-type sugar transport system ATPase subunit